MFPVIKQLQGIKTYLVLLSTMIVAILGFVIGKDILTHQEVSKSSATNHTNKDLKKITKTPLANKLSISNHKEDKREEFSSKKEATERVASVDEKEEQDVSLDREEASQLQDVAVTELESSDASQLTSYSQEAVQTTTPASYVATSPQYATTAVHGYALANGNTAGEIGTSAAAQMAAATGVSQSTWEYIIARESNGNPNVANSSGAAGLFQTMPGWGSTATVQDQINSAINAYNSQGLSAWGLQ